ncbi:sulfurtransferase TusA family protein [Tissierellaceae bacterium HCP3S3_D8]
MNKIDTCGMSCPQPVLMTKNALDRDPNGVDIIVDNNTAKGNIERFLKNSGYSISVKEEGDTFIIEARK